MKHIRKIDIILENCECITLDAKYFGEFMLEGINEHIRRIASNSISKSKYANEVAIEIFKEANNVEYSPFGSNKTSKIFDRLTQYNDITSFRVYYGNEEDIKDKKRKKDEEKEEYEDIYISWYGDSDNENESQISYISSQGNLYIVIAKDKNIDDYFVSEDIEDVETMDFHRTMIIN